MEVRVFFFFFLAAAVSAVRGVDSVPPPPTKSASTEDVESTELALLSRPTVPLPMLLALPRRTTATHTSHTRCNFLFW